MGIYRVPGAHGNFGRTVLDDLLPVLYEDLRRIARREIGREHAPPTLNATDLVHEAYLRLAASRPEAADRAHMLALASRVMRQVLVDRARRRRADKRGGGAERVTLSGLPVAAGELDEAELLALDDALAQLEPRQRQVVECRFFGGMSEAEIAEALGVTERTVRRDWVKARAWLYRDLYTGS